MKRIISILTVVAVVLFAGYNVYKAQQREVLSDVAMANVEALANNESGIDRPDCEPAIDLCSMITVYPDGDYGEDIVLGMKKKPGWI